MNYYIDIQNASEQDLPLTDEEITQISSRALRDNTDKAELTVRLVTSKVIQKLNNTYRKQDKPTNVLSFPAAIPAEVALEYPLLGDIIICPEVLVQESVSMNKSLKAHWSLILIHGVLHLLGYDHIKDDEAAIMQAKEIEILAELGYDNPYIGED